MSKSTVTASTEIGRRFFTILTIIFLSSSFKAYSWYGGGYCHSGCGYWENGGWCGTDIPIGLGWTLFGLEAAAAIAAPTTILDSELNSLPCYTFDGNIDYAASGYADPYFPYVDGTPYILSPPWPLVIGLGYPFYPLYGWSWGGYGCGGIPGYCYSGWHVSRGYGYGGGCVYCSGLQGGANPTVYSRGNDYYSVNAGGARTYGEPNLTSPGNFHTPTSLTEAEQNYHVQTRNSLPMAVSTTRRATLASAEQNYHAPVEQSLSESTYKSHKNTLRFSSPNGFESRPVGTSPKSEAPTNAHPGFHGIDPVAYMNEKVSSPNSTSQRTRTPSDYSTDSHKKITDQRSILTGLKLAKNSIAGDPALLTQSKSPAKQSFASASRGGSFAKSSGSAVTTTGSHSALVPSIVQKSLPHPHESSNVGINPATHSGINASPVR
jgi:hypothetical protein